MNTPNVYLEGSVTDHFNQIDAGEKRGADPTPLTAAELKELPFTTLEHVLWAAIRQLNPARVAVLLASRRFSATHLNTRNLQNEGDDRVTYLSCAALQPAKTSDDTRRKLAIIKLLLDAGATNVNDGYYLMGVSGYSAFMAACDARLWPGITQESHRELVARLYRAGGQPNFRFHPLGTTAHGIAAEHAPYLLDLLPANEQTDGQLSLFKTTGALQERITEAVPFTT
jgi:hypothetical protein